MARRNYVSEITERRARNKQTLRIAGFSSRYGSIADALERMLSQAAPNDTFFDKELSRHFPVALVAAVEGYFREAICDLAVLGSPYRERIAQLARRQPSEDVTQAISDGRISVGEWYAHVVHFGGIQDIDRTLSDVLGFPFLDRVMTSSFKLPWENEEPSNLNLRGTEPEFECAVRDLFRTRHILCHEFASEVSIDTAALLRMLTASDLLVALSEVVIYVEAEQRR